MNIVAILALHQAFIHSMAEWHSKIGASAAMTAVTKLGLSFDQQVFRSGAVRGMAIETPDVVA